MVLLVFGDEIVQVRFSLGEFHLVHTLTGVPVEEGLSAENDSELFGDTLPCFLDGSGVTNEDTRHIKSLGWDVTDGCLDVVRDPFDKVGRVLVGHFVHLGADLCGGNLSSEHHGAGEVTSVTRISGAHHVLGIECLLGELRYRQDTVLLDILGGQGCESNQKEVKTRERNKVDGKLSKITVELSGESKGASSSSDGVGNQDIQVSVGGVIELKGAEANVVKSLVIKSETLVGVLDKLVGGERGIVSLNNGVRNLRRRDDTVGADYTVGVFLLNLGDEKRSHTRSGTSSHRVGDLESLKNVTVFSFLADALHDLVDKFGSFGVVTLGPVISGSALSKDKVVGAEKTTNDSGADGIHGSGFQISKNGSGNIAVEYIDTERQRLAHGKNEKFDLEARK